MTLRRLSFSLIFAFTTLLVSNIAHALYVDTDTGLTWLELTETVGLAQTELELQLADGGDYDQWRYATAFEVQALRDSFGLPASGFYADGLPQNMHQIESIRAFISVMGSTVGDYHILADGAAASNGAIGLTDELIFSVQASGHGDEAFVVGQDLCLTCNESRWGIADQFAMGYYLVLEEVVVSAPSAGVVLFGLAGFGVMSRRRRS